MLKIDPRFIAAVESSESKTDLYPFLQKAVELEHATIPPYLTAYYSLKPGLNDDIAGLIRSVVVEEMLHMTIAANILVSLGGSPAINSPDFVPDYPGPLPMGIGGRDFIVGIEAFSLDLVQKTFMVIEEPEHPVDTDDKVVAGVDLPPPTFRTIGEFYEAIQARLADLPTSDFGNEDRQVLTAFKHDLVFPIIDSDSACMAIEIIKTQGEGTSTDPFESPGDPAHYYRFGEIYAGNKLVKTADGYEYGGDPVPFVQDGVFPMKPNPHSEQFPADTYGRLLSDNFTDGYSTVLNSLHDAFNGQPDRIKAGIGLMYQLRFMAQKLMSTPLGDCSDATAGPVYKYRK